MSNSTQPLYQTESQINNWHKLMMVRGAFSNMKKCDDAINGLIPLDDYIKECKTQSKLNHKKYIDKWTNNSNGTYFLNGVPARQWFLKHFDNTIDRYIANVEYLANTMKILTQIPTEKSVNDNMIVSIGCGDDSIRTKIVFKSLSYQQGFQINIGGIDDISNKPYGIIIPYLTLPKTIDDLINDLCLLNYPNIVSSKLFNNDIIKHQYFYHHANDIDVDLSLKPINILDNLQSSKLLK